MTSAAICISRDTFDGLAGLVFLAVVVYLVLRVLGYPGRA